MRFPPKIRALVIATTMPFVALGCTREIGDGCTTGTDCSQTGGRTCDTTMPGGYCTIANCEPDSCPEEAACLGFVLAPSTAAECKGLDTNMSELRRFCMRRCSSQDDCRGGYVCADLNHKDNEWGAKLLDNSRSDGRVCVLAYGAEPSISSQAKAGYCSTSTAFVDSDKYYSVGGARAIGSETAGSAGAASAGTGNVASAGAANGHAGEAGAGGSESGQGGSAGHATISNAGSAGVAIPN